MQTRFRIWPRVTFEPQAEAFSKAINRKCHNPFETPLLTLEWAWKAFICAYHAPTQSFGRFLPLFFPAWIHFVFVRPKQSPVAFWKASCYFWKVFSENFTDIFVRFVRFIVFNEIPFESVIAFHIFRHICLLTSGSANSSKTNGAKRLTSVNQ